MNKAKNSPISSKEREKILEVFKKNSPHIHASGRVIMIMVSIFFIIFGAIAFFISWYELYKDLFIEEVKSMGSIFIHLAEWYLISITFVILGRSIVIFSLEEKMEKMDIDEFKKNLFTMIVSISVVFFVDILLSCKISWNGNPLPINNLLGPSLSISIIIISLSIYLKLTEKRKLEEKKEEKEEKEEEAVELPQPPQEEKETSQEEVGRESEKG